MRGGRRNTAQQLIYFVARSLLGARSRTMSVQDRFPHSTAELRRVKAVQFGILSPDEIVRALFLLPTRFPRRPRRVRPSPRRTPPVAPAKKMAKNLFLWLARVETGARTPVFLVGCPPPASPLSLSLSLPLIDRSREMLLSPPIIPTPPARP